MNDFSSLGLDARLLKALAQEGYTAPTPIQSQAIPRVLEGRDLLGIAQTGTGKTASFALPILQRLDANKRQAAPKTARALILSPTRELSAQIADSFKVYGRYMNQTVTTIFGGVGEGPQIQTMRGGIDILVATPGRLLDLVNQRAVDLTKTEIFVLDEADRMLDMGFIRDIKRLVVHLPRDRQNLFFSATMPEEIGSLAGDLLKDPVSVSVTPAATTVERIKQRVIHVEAGSKRALLVDLLRKHEDMNRTLVFTKTKHGADKVVRALAAAGIVAAAIHGNKSQSQRVQTLNAFRAGRTRVLIATDIAARGIDVDGISHVVNFDLPHVAESYVHRIGRTARAGADGIAIAFCDREERSLLRDIEKLTRQTIPASEWKPRPLQPGEVAEVAIVEHTRPERRDEQRRENRGPRRDDRRGPRKDDRRHAPREDRPAQPQAASGYGERAAHAPRPHGEHAPRPHGAKPHGKPHGERNAHAPRPHGEHAPRPHGAKPHGKPFRGKPHGERAAQVTEAGAGARPFNGPKRHRKGHNPNRPQGNGHAPGTTLKDAGGNALPRFLQRKARQH